MCVIEIFSKGVNMKQIFVIVMAVMAALMCEAKDSTSSKVRTSGANTGVRSAKKSTTRPQMVKKTVATQPQKANPFRKTPYVGAIAVDAQTGRVLFRDHSDALARPASVTKLMTALLVLEDVAAGKYNFNAVVTATPDVYKAEPSWVGVKPGETMTVDSLLYALMVQSANDAAIMLGVHSAGSLEGFVARMNGRAAQLGMSSTRYYNPNGLPPKRKNGAKDFNVTTCEDQVKLAREILKHTRILKYTSVKVWPATYDGVRPITGLNLAKQPEQRKFINHNNVMVKDKLKIYNPDGREAIDGLKTGYIDAGGSSVVLTGVRNGKRAIVIVLGSDTARLRDDNARRLMIDALGAL